MLERTNWGCPGPFHELTGRGPILREWPGCCRPGVWPRHRQWQREGVSGDWQRAGTANCTSGVGMGAWLLTTTTKNQKEWREAGRELLSPGKDAKLSHGLSDGRTRWWSHVLKFRPVGQARECSGALVRLHLEEPLCRCPLPTSQLPAARLPLPTQVKSKLPSALVTSLDSYLFELFCPLEYFS